MKTANDSYWYLCFRIARKAEQPRHLSKEEAKSRLAQRIDYVPDDFADKGLRMQCAALFAQDLLTDKLLQRIAASVESAYRQDEKRYGAIEIVFPTSLVKYDDLNRIPLAQTAILQKNLKGFLPEDMQDLPVRANIDSKDQIFNAAKNRRGKAYDRENPLQNLVNGIGKLAKQPIFTGEVRPDVLYIICDDAVCTQTTLRALGGYIAQRGGTVAAISTLIKRQGSEQMNLTPETLACLNAVLSHGQNDTEVNWTGQVNKKRLNNLLSEIGLSIDFEKLENSTISNFETLLICSYLMDWLNDTHRETFLNALSTVNSSPEALEKEGIGNLCYQQAGTIEGLKLCFQLALQDSTMAIGMKNSAYGR